MHLLQDCKMLPIQIVSYIPSTHRHGPPSVPIEAGFHGAFTAGTHHIWNPEWNVLVAHTHIYIYIYLFIYLFILIIPLGMATANGFGFMKFTYMEMACLWK